MLLVSTLSFATPCKVCTTETSLRCPNCKSAYYCCRDHQRSDSQNHKKDCRTWALHKDLVGNVTIAPSSLDGAGLGLFTQKDIPSGNPIAGYLGYSIGVESAYNCKATQNMYLADTIVGHTDRTYPDHLIGGQFANDGAVTAENIKTLLSVNCSAMTDTYLKSIQDFSASYLEHEFDANNAGFYRNNKLIAGVCALKPIEKNAEVLIGYGLNFWISVAADLCSRKGFPLATASIYHAASLAALHRSEHALPYTHPENFFFNYLDNDEFEDFKNTMRKNELSTQLVALFGHSHLIGIHIHTMSKWQQLLQTVDAQNRIKEIQALPNEAFRSSTTHHDIHPKSIALAEALFTAAEQTKEPIFQWFDARTRQFLTQKAFLQSIKNDYPTHLVK